MTDERLEEMRQFLSWQPSFPEPGSTHELLVTYTRELLAEIDRLRAQVAAMLPIVEAVAHSTTTHAVLVPMSTAEGARALLAKEGGS